MEYVNTLSFINKMLNRVEIKLKRSRLISRPVEISIEPTVSCNSNCVMCTKRAFREDKCMPEGFLSWEILRKAKPFFKYAERVLLSGFGESLLHPDYLDMLKAVKKSGPFVYLYTNAILMDEKLGRGLVDAGIDMICVSHGGATRETYKKIRGVDAFHTVVENVRSVSEYKKKTGSTKPLLSFNVVAMNSVLPELEALVELAHEIGVEDISLPNLIVQSESMIEESPWNNVEEAEKAFRKAMALAQKYNISFQVPKLEVRKSVCRELFRKMYITWSGEVISCAQERYIIGDLNKSRISSIWNGKPFVRLRRDTYKKGLDGLCKDCPIFDNRPETYILSRINSRLYAKRLNK